MAEDSGTASAEQQVLPPLRPIRRLHVLLRYRFGQISAIALLLTLILSLPFTISITAWILGAATYLLLATGGIPESTVAADDATRRKPDRWIPEYNGLHLIGLGFAFLLMLLGSLGAEFGKEDLKDGLLHVTAATTGWILMRRALMLLSVGFGKTPWIGRHLSFLQPTHLYLAVVLGFFILLLLAGGVNSFETLRTNFLAFLGAVLIIIVPAISFRTFVAPVTVKGIANHFSILVSLAFFITGAGTLVEPSFFIDNILKLWPIQFVSDRASNEIFTLGLFVVLLAMLVNLRKRLVIEQAGTETPAALSIHPDPATYVDDDGYEAGVAKLVSHSNGGVVGITGVRGAGKSALLAKIRARFLDHYCVVWTVAPVSHRGGDDLSFLMSVCRTVCQKAIDDAQEVLYGRRNTFQQAGEEFLRRIRVPLIVLAILIGLLLLGRGTGLQESTLFGEMLPPPDNYRLGTARIPTNTEETRKSFQESLSAERLAIRRLVARIEAVLPAEDKKQTSKASKTSFAIVPLVGHRGFDLVLGDSSSVDPGILLKNHIWLADDVRTKSEGYQVDEEFGRFRDETLSYEDEIYRKKFREYFRYLPKTATDVAAFNQLQKFFHRQIAGGTLSFHKRFSPLLRRSFEHRIISLSMLRGYPGLELHLGALTADLKDILNTTNKGVEHTEWASIVLLAAYLDRIAPLLDQNISPNKKKEAATELFMDKDRLRRLHAVLVRYLEVLKGKTLTAGLTDAGSVQPRSGGIFENILARSGELDTQFVWTFFGILFLALLPEIWLAGNFVLRGLFNYQLLVLMRESDQFLEALEYSEGREASAGVSFKGLFNLAGKRTLTSRALTLQSLTDRYQDYVSSLLTHYNGKLIVIIDELDKMVDPEDVKRVLLELKGALFQRGCYYLISISEDCAKAFHGRLIEGRDIFESTFEDIIAIRQMASSAARKMVGNRLKTDKSAPELSDTAIDILTVFSGAIPREIVRHLRDIVLVPRGEKSVNPKSIGCDIFEKEVNQWMDQLRTAPYAGQHLIVLRENCQELLKALPKSMEEDWPDQANESVKDGSKKSIGVVLADCLDILDPDGTWRRNQIVSGLEIPSDAENRKALHAAVLAELQACIRLMVMNELMRFIWRTGQLCEDQSQSTIVCFRTVMLNPAIAEQMLKEIAVENLGLIYPEDKPTKKDTHLAVDAATE